MPITITVNAQNIEDVYDGQRYPTKRFAKWAECAMCNHVTTQDQMQQIDGKWYCFRYGCVEEVIDRKARDR
jgi:hypothetical protein